VIRARAAPILPSREKTVEAPIEWFIKLKTGQVKADLGFLEAGLVLVLVLHSGSRGRRIENDNEDEKHDPRDQPGRSGG
jgi:hypothetical protein